MPLLENVGLQVMPAPWYGRPSTDIGTWDARGESQELQQAIYYEVIVSVHWW